MKRPKKLLSPKTILAVLAVSLILACLPHKPEPLFICGDCAEDISVKVFGQPNAWFVDATYPYHFYCGPNDACAMSPYPEGTRLSYHTVVKNALLENIFFWILITSGVGVIISVLRRQKT
jgi:hypothetical protein